MPLDLNDMRSEFAAHLAADPGRFSMDVALAHVLRLAYERGVQDGEDSRKEEEK